MAHILVVDDEPDVVTLIKFLLQKDGHEVSSAKNGAEALDLLGIEPKRAGVALPDLVVVDVMMPVMDGYTMTTRLREAPQTRAIPLLVLTAKGQTRELFDRIPNVAAHIEKPFDPKALRELIGGMLGGKE